MPLHPVAVVPRRRNHRDDELVEMGAVRHRGLERPVIRRARIFRQSPEAVNAPGRDLLVREVVMLGRGRHQPGRHPQQHRQVGAGGQQSGERGQHIGVDSVQATAEPVLHPGDRQRARRAFKPLEQDRAASAPESQLERRLAADPQQPAAGEGAAALGGASPKRSTAAASSAPSCRMPELARITPERYPLTGGDDTQFRRREEARSLPENADPLVMMRVSPGSACRAGWRRAGDSPRPGQEPAAFLPTASQPSAETEDVAGQHADGGQRR